jgi:tetratricopeptide (TPR) repeat protein
MRKLNVKFLLYLVVGTVLVVGAVFLVHRLQAAQMAEALLWQADRAEKEGRLEQTARYLRRYLEFEPGDLDNRARLGRILASPQLAVTPKTREQARFVLEQVLTREPKRHDVRLLLVRMALDLERYDLAAEHLNLLRLANSADADVLALTGQMYEAQGKDVEAIPWLAKAMQQAPGKVEHFVRLAYLLRRLDRVREGNEARQADKVMNELVARNPSSYQAHLERWRYRKLFTNLKQTSALQEAEKDVQEAMRLAGTEVDVLLASADLAQMKDELPKARAQLEEAIKRYPRDGRPYQALANVHVQTGELTQAVACLRRGLGAVAAASQFDLLWALANVLIDGNKLDEAEKTITQIRKQNYSTIGIEYLQARCLMQQGHWSEAVKALESLQPRLKTAPELTRQVDLHLGTCYEHLEDPAARQKALARVIEQDPASVPARLQQVNLHWEAGRIDAAIAEYRQIMKLPQAPPDGWVVIARMLLLSNLQSERPNWNEVEDALAWALKAQPSGMEVWLLKAELLVAQKKLDDAENVLTTLNEHRKGKEITIWAALVNLAEHRKQPQKARQLLAEAQKNVKDSVELRLLRARLDLKKADAGAAKVLAELEQGLEKFSAVERSRLLNGLAEASFRAGNTKDAQRLWRQLAKEPEHANDLRLRFLLLDLALEAGEESGIRQTLDEIKRIEGGELSLWRYGEAARLIHQAKQGGPGKKDLLTQARTLLDTVAKQRPSWPVVAVARAEMEEVRGNPEQAIANYRQALDLGERSPRVLRQLVQLLFSRQRYQEAEQEIHKFQKTAPFSSDVQRLVVVLSLQNQNYSRAEQLVQQSVAADSQDYREHLWIGQVLAARPQPSAQAQKSLRRAVALGGKYAETWVSLVQYLAATKQIEEAEKVIAQAQAAMLPEQKSLGLAQCYEALGRSEQAQKHYQEALSAHPEDVLVVRSVGAYFLRTGKAADAEPLLRQILQRKIKVSDSDVAWARRSLALFLATAVDFSRYRDALALVGVALDEKGNLTSKTLDSEETLEDVAVRAKVLAAHHVRSCRDRALALFEDLQKRQALTPDDQFVLAQLYDSKGPDPVWWKKARNQLEDLTSVYSKNPIYLSYYALALLRRGEAREAQRVIDLLAQAEKVRQVERGLFGSVELRARAWEALGQGKKAVEELRSYAEEPSAKPERRLLLAVCLARQKQLTEALELCDKAWTNCEPEAVGGASIAVLRTGKPSEEQYERVEKALRAAIDKSSAPAILQTQLADLLDLRGRFADAEALYRKVLEKDARNVIGLNNLAWLLAQKPGKAAEALGLINRAIGFSGPRPELLDTRAVAYLALGQGKEALADLEEATREAPTPTRTFHLARAHHLVNNSKAAVAALRKAQADGLDAPLLHPIERDTYSKLVAELRLR